MCLNNIEIEEIKKVYIKKLNNEITYDEWRAYAMTKSEYFINRVYNMFEN